MASQRRLKSPHRLYPLGAALTLVSVWSCTSESEPLAKAPQPQAPATAPAKVAPTREALAELNEKLRGAAAKGDVSAVEMLLAQGADVNSQGSFQETALGEAIKRGQSGVIEVLLKAGANPNKRAGDEWSLLHVLVNSSHKIDLLKLALEHKADVNAKDSDDTYPLFPAVYSGREVVVTLLDAGADINSRNGSTGQTPLHRAVLVSSSVSELLIRRGADVNIKTKEGKTVDAFLEEGPFSEAQKQHIRSLIQTRKNDR